MSTDWKSSNKWLHWLSVVAILVIVPVGYWMTTLYGYSLQYPELKSDFDLSSKIHHTLGYFILVVTIARVFLRFRVGKGRSNDTSSISGFVSKCVQCIMYGVLIGLPITGWAALSALADSPEFGATQIWFFHLDDVIPRIVEAKHWSDADGYRRYASLHRYLIYAGGMLLGCHIAAAIYHHWVKKDRTLIGMLPKR